MIQLTFQYPLWFFFLCIILAAAYAFALYYRNKTFIGSVKHSKSLIWVLAALRFLAVLVISFLLLSPLIKTLSNNTEKPIIAIVQDNSKSISAGLGKDTLSYKNALAQLGNELSKNYNVKYFSAGSRVAENHDFSFNEKSSNLSDALTTVSDLFANQNLGAIVFATDGIYNQGSNPLYSNINGTIPVFTIALGDSTIKKDLRFLQTQTNQIVFLGNSFAVRANVDAQFCSNENSSISISEVLPGGEKIISEQPFNINSASWQNDFDFLINATHSGVMHLRLRLKTVDGEISTTNNIRDIFVEVMDGKEKILLLANAVHPDIHAIKESIQSNQNYQVDVQYINNFNNQFQDYSLVILYQLPTANGNGNSIVANIRKLNIPVLYILGAQTGLNNFNSSNISLSVAGNGTTSDASPIFNSSFALFGITTQTQNALQQFPPLHAPFGNYKTSATVQPLLFQKIGSVSTQYPLLAFEQNNAAKIGFLCGEGFWRWRFYDFEQNKNHDATDELMNRVIQYLSVRPDKNPFTVTLENSALSGTHIYTEDESLLFNATLHNETFDAVTTPDVNLVITNKDGKEFPFVFSKSDAVYHLNAGNFSEGNYTWKSSVNFNNKSFTQSGTFTVSTLQLESMQTHADHHLLYSISQKTGGKLFYPNQLTSLKDSIEHLSGLKSVIYTTHKTSPVIDLKWLFIIIISFVFAEWFLRKINSGY